MSLAGEDKQRWPQQVGMEVAAELCRRLKPACARLIVGGSLRRRRSTIGDLEIIYIPRQGVVKRLDDLFEGSAFVDMAALVITEFEKSRILERRLNSRGTETFGGKNKLMRHVRTGLPVDLFATVEESWWNYVVCRTGPAESNTRIAVAAERKGWKWRPYSPGFERGGQIHAVHSEEEVFRFVGLPHLPPAERQ